MVQNSPKPVETGNPQVFALQVVRGWLEREGGRQRIPAALRELVGSTETALARGDAAPTKDTATLDDIHRLERRDPGGGTGTPLRGSDIRRWWATRERQIQQLCADEGCAWVPRLVVQTGGGRGLPTLFSIDFDPIASAAVEPPESAAESASDTLHYRVDPARPSLWYRLVLGTKPFPIGSWRGYVVVGSLALDFLFVALIWVVFYLSWSRGRPITTAEVAAVVPAILITAGIWFLTKPIRALPSRRVTLAGATFLALSELHGQLRTMPDERKFGARRTLSLVRHWGFCPTCSAEVDLDEGGAAFPDRLIGRCQDAPLEHVYSFDPVRLIGEPLRPGSRQ